MSAEAIPCSNALSRIDVGPRAGDQSVSHLRCRYAAPAGLFLLTGVGIVFKEAVGKWAHRAAAIP